MLVGEDEDNTRSLQREASEISSLLKEFPKNTNILVVDTNFITLLNMKRIMRQYAYQVKIEADAEKAFAFLTSCKHDINIVIWDFNMPVINGIQALKSIGSKMDLPVVIMSDDNQTESMMEATIHGACDYVMKPVREEVIANIWQHIVRKRMMSQKMKMMSQPDLIPPVQSDLAQSDGLDKDKADSKILDDQEQNIDRKEENEAKRTRTTWTEGSQLVQPDLVQTNYVDQHSGSITIYQDKGEEEKAANIPRITWTGEIQLVQSDPVQTYGLDQHNGGFQFINQDNDEPNIEKKEWRQQRRQRMTWNHDLHQKFLEAIEIVGGIRRASPKLIHECLEGMNVEGLTRYNVASHLQKHRLTLEESEFRQQTKEIGWSTAYKPTRRYQGSNNVYLRNDSNNVSLMNDSNNVQTAISSSYLTNGQAVNPIQQNQYQNGYLTMNNNQFITNNSNNVQTAISSSYLTNGQAVNPIQQNQYQNGHLTMNNNQFITNDSNNVQTAISSSYLTNGRQAVNPIQQNQYQNGYLTMNNNQFITNDSNNVQTAISSSYLTNGRQAVNPIQHNQYQNGYLTMNNNQFITNDSNNVQTAISSSYLTNGRQAVDPIQQNQYQNGYLTMNNNQFITNDSNNVQTAISSSYLTNGRQAVDPIQQNQYQNGNLTMNNNQFITNPLPPLPYVDHRLHQHQQQQYLHQQQQYQSSHQFNYVVSNGEPEQTSGIGVTGLELTYPNVPYDPLEHLLRG